MYTYTKTVSCTLRLCRENTVSVCILEYQSRHQSQYIYIIYRYSVILYTILRVHTRCTISLCHRLSACTQSDLVNTRNPNTVPGNLFYHFLVTMIQ